MKKSQIQLGESTAVVMIIVVLIFIGLVIYYQFWNAGRVDEIDGQREIAAIELATKTTYMPEFHCTFQGRTSTNCYDKYKLEFMATNIGQPSWKNYYYDYFGFAKIEMFEVYPTEKNYTLYENQKDTATQSAQPVFIPAKVYDSVSDTYAFSYLKVTKYT